MQRNIINLFIIAMSFFVISISTFSCDPPTAAKTTGDISGTVTDSKTSQPINGAMVSTDPATSSVTTGNDGLFIFEKLDPGTYKVIATKDDYETNQKNVTVTAGEKTNADISLTSIIPQFNVSNTNMDFGTSLSQVSLEITNTTAGKLEWSVVESIVWLNANPTSGETGEGETSTVTFTVDRSTLMQGTHSDNITISSVNGGSKDISVSVTIAGPVLNIEPNNLNFGTTETEKTMQITNAGIGDLSYELEANKSWIAISPSNGNVSTEIDNITVTVNRNGLSYGSYSGIITANSNANSVNVDVLMTIPDPNAPLMSVSAVTIDFGTNETTRILTITNNGNGDLNWNISINQNWLSLSAESGTTSGGLSDDVSVMVDRSNLTPGAYDDQLSITSNGGDIYIDVRMEILSEPVLSYNMEELDFERIETQMNFIISNTGTGELTWNLTKNQDWISINPTSGTNQSTINVSVDRSGLNYGSYSGEISISSNGGYGSVLVYMEYAASNQPPTAVFTVSPETGLLETVFSFDASDSYDDYDTTMIALTQGGFRDVKSLKNKTHRKVRPVTRQKKKVMSIKGGTRNIDNRNTGNTITNARAQLEFRWRWETSSSFTAWTTENTAEHQYSSIGTKTVTLEVKDAEGAIGSATTNISVIENQAPTASFTITPELGPTDTNFEVDASNSSDDLDPPSALEVRWQWEENGSFTNWTTVKTANHQYSTSGEKTITLEVKDTQGEIGTTTQTVLVNNPPTASFTVTPTSGDGSTNFQVNANESTDDLDALSELQVRWQWEDGGTFTNWTTTKTASHQYTTSGSKTITLEVKDTHGEIGSTTNEIIVNDSPTASFTITPELGPTDTNFEVDASNSSDDLDPPSALEVRWQWEENGSFTNWTTVKTANHQYSTSGEKTITLEVKDTQGEIGTTTQTVLVNNPPTASFTVTPTSGDGSTNFQVNANESTDDLDALSELQVRWQWEDGGTFTNWTTTKTASHQYTTSGSKTITLEVKDTHGEIGSTTQIVIVTNTPPNAVFTVSPEIGDGDTEFSVDASGSSDDFDDINELQVRWRWETGGNFTPWTVEKTATHEYDSDGAKIITLEIMDSYNEISAVTNTVTVNNLPPEASFTIIPSSGTIDTLFEVDATGSTDDLDDISQLQVRWRWEDGESFTSWTTNKTANHYYTTSSGSKTITLEIKDTNDDVGTTTNTVTVNNNPPAASFTVTPLSGDATTTFTVDASASTDDFDDLSELQVRWRWEAGESFTAWTTVTQYHQYSSAGVKTITLEVKDTNGDISSTTNTVTVNNNPPTASFTVTPTTGDGSTAFNVDASSSSDDFDDLPELHVRWRWEAGESFTAWTTVKTAEHQYSSSGVKTITLEVGDTNSEINSTTNTVTVNNNPPNASFTVSPSTGNGYTNFAVNASSSSDDFDDLSELQVRWRWETGGNFTNWSTTKTAQHQYTSVGIKTITIEVKDTDNEVSTISDSIEVINQYPVASFTVVPDWGYTSSTVFNVDASSCTDDFDDISELQVRWQWEDGGTFTNWTTTKTASHQYSSIGTKTITLEVLDSDGSIASAQNTVDVYGEGSEIEPNDSQYEAQLIDANSTINGDIGYGTDEEDWYEIVMSANGTFVYSVSNLHPSGTSYGDMGNVYLYDESLTQLTYINDNYLEDGESSSSSTIVVSGGYTYYIKVTPENSSHAAPYELSTYFTELTTTDYGEPNDSQYQTTTIPETGTLTALIGYGNDEEDWYEIVMPNNGTFVYSVSNLHPSGTGYADMGHVYLYDGSLTQLTYINKTYLEDGESATSSSIVVSGGYTYYIKVTPKDSDEAAPYELSTYFTELTTTDYGEPNDSQYQTTTIPETGTLTALIGYGNDEEDWYEIVMPNNGTFVYSVSNLHPSGTGYADMGHVYLYDGSLTQLTYINKTYLEDGESATSSSIVVSGGYTYYIKVTPENSSHSAPYQLQLFFQ